MSAANDRPGGGAGAASRAILWYRRLVLLSLIFSLVALLVSVGSLIVLVNQPYGGFLWAWENAYGLYRVDNFSPGGTDTLQPADFVLAVAGHGGSSTYPAAQERYRAARSICAENPPADPPMVTYQVLRRGEQIEVSVPVRCFRFTSLLRVASILVVLGVMIWAIGLAVYRADSGRELNLVFAFCMAWITNVVVIESANIPLAFSPVGKIVNLFINNPSPILAAAGLYHLVAILPRQHPSDWLRRSRWLWYLVIPLILVVLGTARYVLGREWHPLLGRIDQISWWGVVIFLSGVAVVIVLRYSTIYFTTSSRQAKSQVRLILLSMLMVAIGLPFLLAQREPHVLRSIPINQPVLLFWLAPIVIIIAYAILRFQVFPGRVRGLNILIGLAVTVIVAMIASPIPQLEPELGFLALLLVLAGTGMFWALPNPVFRVLRRFTSPGTIERSVIERFGADIQNIQDLERLSTVLVQSLEEHLQLRFAALWLEGEPGLFILESFSDHAPSQDLPDVLSADQTWSDTPTRVESGVMAQAKCKIMLPLEAAGRRVGVLGVGERWTEEVFDETDLAAMEVMADQAALTLSTARQIRALRMVPLQIEQAQLDERDRIAQDLHDSTQAQLTQLAFALERVRGSLYTDPARGEELLDGCIRDVNQAARDLRAILRDLIPRRLLGQTLTSLLQEYVDSVSEYHKTVYTELRIDSEIEALLSNDHKVTLLRICQQALDNALAHAEATTISITLQPSHDLSRIEFSIVDDGRGFVPRPMGEFVEWGHHGLYILQSRVLQSQGYLEIDSTPGQGTVVKGYVPAGN
jgi:signal transduction histidine kinase